MLFPLPESPSASSETGSIAIIEALKCLKLLLHRDLIWRVLPTVAEEEALLNNADEHPTNNQEEYTRDAVAGADAWMWEEVEDIDGTQRNVGSDDDSGNANANMSRDSIELVN